MIVTALHEFLTSAGIPYALAANVATGEVDSFGDATAIVGTDLVNTLFADRESINALQRSLQGQLLPRIWSQGDLTCIVCKPSEDVIVGLFCRALRDPVEQYHRSTNLNDELCRLWP